MIQEDLILKFTMLKRIGAVLSLALILLSTLGGCAARALPTSEEDLAVVGTVGEYEVLYEEFRFLVLLHKGTLESQYAAEHNVENGADLWKIPEEKEKNLARLKELVYEDLKANYAILTLGAEAGLTVDSYQEAVQAYMESSIESEFNGDRSIYKDFLLASGLTDHYLRFTSAVDHVYEDLYVSYLKSGKISDDETTVKQFILQNFVRVMSICLVNKTEEESAENLKRLEQYRKEVLEGADIKDYVRYTVDPSPDHCFMRGEMDETFERYAFALEKNGDVSEIFLSTADYLSAEREAWYFLQKASLHPEYVDKHYDTLFDSYTTGVMNQYIEAAKESLTFVPNDYCKSIDLLSVEPLKSIKDNTWVFVLIGVGVAVILIAAVIVLIRILNPKPDPIVKPDRKLDAKKKAK